MYIVTENLPIQLMRKGGKLYAPIEVRGVSIALQFHSMKGVCPNADVRKGNLSPLSNNRVFQETIRRLEFLVDYIQSEKLEYFSQLPLKINGVDYLGQERLIAFKISAKLRGI